MRKSKSSKDQAPTQTPVSVEKLFERAAAASLERKPGIAIELLNEVLQRDPYHAGARHLLGAEYAQSGKIDDALVEMGTALELNPNMPLARFQLGLLLITSDRIDEAAQVWAPLDALGSDHVLNRFRDGMMQMAHGSYDSARQVLATAMAENDYLPALNHEMLVVIEAIASRSNSAQKTEAPDTEESKIEDPNSQHILVSAYAQSPTVH